jgi:hypothetical protein
MAYNQRARELRRCMSLTKAGTPCCGWAVWQDSLQRCGAHGGKRRWRGRESYITVYPPCTCIAYSWPHRPGGGLCRWPDSPKYRCTTPASTHSLGHKHRRALRW